MNEPEWLTKMKAEGRVTEKGINLDALTSVASSDIIEKVLEDASEKYFQKIVIDEAHACGWKVAHFRKVRVQRASGEVYWETPVAADGKGFPDLMLVHQHLGIMFFELKAHGNTATTEQLEWLALLQAAGIYFSIMYPDNWNLIAKLLRNGPKAI